MLAVRAVCSLPTAVSHEIQLRGTGNHTTRTGSLRGKIRYIFKAPLEAAQHAQLETIVRGFGLNLTDETIGLIAHAISDFGKDKTTSQAAEPTTTKKKTVGQRNAYYATQASTSARDEPAYMLFVISSGKASKDDDRQGWKMCIQFNGKDGRYAEVDIKKRGSMMPELEEWSDAWAQFAAGCALEGA